MDNIWQVATTFDRARFMELYGYTRIKYCVQLLMIQASYIGNGREIARQSIVTTLSSLRDGFPRSRTPIRAHALGSRVVYCNTERMCAISRRNPLREVKPQARISR